MGTYRSVIYGLWFAIPIGLVLFGLYATLETAAKSRQKHNPGDYFRPAVFISVCIFVSLGLDMYILEPHLKPELPGIFNLEFELIQFLTPFVICAVLGKIVPGVEQHRIKKAPRAQDARKKRLTGG